MVGGMRLKFLIEWSKILFYKIKFLTQNAILMVACDKEYDFKDYIEKFSEFLKIVKKDSLWG